MRDLVIAREASTHDRNGGNDNGFSNKAEYVRRVGPFGVDILDIEGPGCIYSLWYSWPNSPAVPRLVERSWARHLRHVKVYFNREESPRIDLPLRRLIGAEPFTFPLSVTGKQSTGGYITYVPMPFERGVKISIGGGKVPLFFYHVWYHTYPYGTPINTYTGKESLTPEMMEHLSGPAAPVPQDRLVSVKGISLDPGGEKEVMRFDSSGTIRSIRMLLPEDDSILRSLRLLIRWDGESEPSVNAPLSLLYAVENRFKSEPAKRVYNADMTGPIIGKDAQGFYYFNLPMPFGREARISLVNDGDNEIEIDEMKVEFDPAEVEGIGIGKGYFKTFFNSSNELEPNRDYLFAHIKGRGHIVGTILAVENTPETFLEGDERIYVDGSRSPFIMGDATETYFNGSWYFFDRAFVCPLHGAPTFRMYDKMGEAVDVTMYRLHLTDLVPFRSEVRFSIQHGPFNDVPGNYRSLVFYYGLDREGLELSDKVEMGDEVNLENHRFKQEGPMRLEERSGFFEGEHDGSWLGKLKKPKRRSYIAHNLILTMRCIYTRPKKDSPDRETFLVREDSSAYEFTVKVDPGNKGVMLRRLFDQTLFDQKATIEVNGEPAGVWYNAGRNKYKRWAEDDYMIGPWLTAGKNEITIRVTPQSKYFTSCEYQVYSLLY